jgi:hypothetical protein
MTQKTHIPTGSLHLRLACALLCLACACGALAAEATPKKQTGPEALFETLDPFYKQHVVADGLLVVSSEKVSKYALDEVAYLAQRMLANRPDLMKHLAEKRRLYITIMAHNEMQTDLPECRGMASWWDYRARGLGGRPVSCAEENVLCYDGDHWRGENIFVHEFAHIIHSAMNSSDAGFKQRLEDLYANTKQSGRFRGYAINNVGEFWAEGVQAWFNCNGAIRQVSARRQSSFEVLGRQGEHICHITSRDLLLKYLPDYAKLLDESFRSNKWVYVPIRRRLDEPHLRGYDPEKAPTFVWPPEVVESFRRYEAEQAKKNKK